jgi:hypothetical protein
MFADLSENSVLQLIAVVLLMAMFGCAVAVLDHWVSARPRQRASSGRTDGLRTSPVGRAGGRGASEMATGVVVISGRWLRTNPRRHEPIPALPRSGGLPCRGGPQAILR